MTWHKGPSNHRDAAHMKMRQAQNRKVCKYNKAENWMYEKLDTTGLSWTRQAVWGWRVFDFWNKELGVAVEVDGTRHDQEKDRKNDAKNWNVSRIIVLRVSNFSEIEANLAIETILSSDTWNDRRIASGKKPITGLPISKTANLQGIL